MSILVSKRQIDETLRTKPVQGKNLVEPLKSFAIETGFPCKILEDVGVQNDAEVHTNESDLWQCLEGEVEFICGGKLVSPTYVKNKDGSENQFELKAAEIIGGTKCVMKPGDWLWIPPGEPHQHSCKATARLVIIKIPSKK